MLLPGEDFGSSVIRGSQSRSDKPRKKGWEEERRRARKMIMAMFNAIAARGDRVKLGVASCVREEKQSRENFIN